MENDASTQEVRGQRTLAAIVFTDGVNFSARMSADEEHTLNLINRDLQFMKDLCGKFEGQVVKSTGDGLLMYFSSAVKAVGCALEIQKTFLRAAISLSPRDVLSHRIGIHLGDVFITETEAMGNGVNIAARLLSEADPGTICISQTVYDVVRSNIALEATYLGRKELKNIQESVPVYRIHPSLPDETPLDFLSQLKQPSTDLETGLIEHPRRHSVIDPASINEDIDYQEPPRHLFDLVVQRLEKNKELLRIKKLIFYACINRWENDRNKLERLQLRGLIQELLEIAPTLGQIKSLLDEIVSTINKKAEYALIANLIINEIQKLYPASQASSQDPCGQIVTELEGNSNVLRIKKLIFYICKGTWENDQTALKNLSFRDLIQDLYRLNPTLEDLQISLARVIETISKRAEYQLVANIIVEKFRKLYVTNSLQQISSQEVSFPVIPQSEPPQTHQNYNVQVHQAAQESRDRQGAPNTVDGSAIAALDLFNLRLEIMKYSNPLRAKILILSTLNQKWANSSDDADLTLLKTHDLDGLLRDLLYEYSSITELESSLEATAQNLDQPDQSSQAAQVIIKGIRPVYENLYS